MEIPLRIRLLGPSCGGSGEAFALLTNKQTKKYKTASPYNQAIVPEVINTFMPGLIL